MTVTDFLLKRIAEDEYLARTCLLEENLHPYGDTSIPAIEPSEWGNLARNYLGGEMGEHCAQQNPARVLAECAAKRTIIAMHETYASSVHESVGIAAFGARCGQEVTGDALTSLAAVYRDHPDYRQEWAA